MCFTDPLARAVQSLALRTRDRADMLRDSASRVLSVPPQVRWTGRAARSWADQVRRVAGDLTRAAEAHDEAAARLTAHAAAVQQVHDETVALATAAAHTAREVASATARTAREVASATGRELSSLADVPPPRRPRLPQRPGGSG